MNVLITGGAGRLGSAICIKLLEQNHRITVLDIAKPKRAIAGVDYVLGSINDSTVLRSLMHRREVVIHLAIAVGSHDYDTPEAPFETNVIGTYRVYKMAMESGVDHIILASEAPVHIPKCNPELDWQSSTGDDYLYDTTKHLQEVLAADFHQTHGLNITILRLGHVVDGTNHTDVHGHPLSELAYCRGGWVSLTDTANVFSKSVMKGPDGYQQYDVIGSIQARQSFAIETTERQLSYRFIHRFEEIDNE